MKFLKEKWHFLIFGLALICIYWIIDFPELFFMRPMGEHAWAQIDRASIALLFYQNDVGFFQPQTHNIALNSSGIAVGEFPLQSFFVSLLYNIFGFHEYLFRGTVLVSSLVGFVVAFVISNKFIANKWLSLIVSLGWILSPNLIYYSTGFLPDTFSLSLFVAGFYFLIKSYPEITHKNLLWFVGFSSLSLLEKSSAMFIYLPVCLGILLHLREQKCSYKTIVFRWSALIIPMLVSFCWIFYASYMQRKLQSNVFLLKPKFPLSLEDFVLILKQFAGKLLDFYPVFIYGLLLLSLFYLILKIKSVPVFFTVIIFGSIVGWGVFFITLSRQAWFHGYYHIPFQFVVFVILFTAVLCYEKSSIQERIRKFHPFILILSFCFGVLSINKYFTERAYHYDLINKNWMDASIALDRFGIHKQSKIVSCNDKSYNISLYLMNRRGWNITNDSWDYFIEKALSECDFLVLTDESILSRNIVRQYVGPFVGRHGSLSIYRINHSVGVIKNP